MKITLIGAGSVVFSKNLTGDILACPEFAEATLCYMDIDGERLEVGAGLCRKVAAGLNVKPRIEATTDTRAALQGADFVIMMFQVGGFDSTLADFEIPRKYGLNFTIGDTTGPGGLFRALRSYPVLTTLCREMADVCPRALLLNYANPMSMNMRAIAHCGIRAVGLCHSVQGTLQAIAWYLGENAQEIDFQCAGINHMAFYLKLQKQGIDLYPRLFQRAGDPTICAHNPVRFELMKRLGYFVTESSEHNAEYNPWFIPRGAETIQRFNIPINEYLHRCDTSLRNFAKLREDSRNDAPLETHRSSEYGATILRAMVTGKPAVVYGNMPNGGAIANLPGDAIAEAPTLVDRNGPVFTTVGELPPQLLGYMQPHVIQHELFLRAAVEARRDHVYQAAMFDPLTGATLTMDKIVEMCDELIAAHGDLLPPLPSRTLVPSSGISFGSANPRAYRESWESVKRGGS